MIYLKRTTQKCTGSAYEALHGIYWWQVAWLDAESVPLTYEDRRVIDDTRFGIVRPLVREWNLQIRDTQLDDQGTYLCSINTDPIRNKVVRLTVHGKLNAVLLRARFVISQHSSKNAEAGLPTEDKTGMTYAPVTASGNNARKTTKLLLGCSWLV